MSSGTGRRDHILGVPNTRQDTQRLYDNLSSVYDWLTGPFESKPREKALQELGIQQNEYVLEIGPGTGQSLKLIAGSVGSEGRAYGVDISPGMVNVARNKIRASSAYSRLGLVLGDAARLAFKPGSLDAVFMSYTLELFDTPEIPKVLAEIRLVLKPGGRIGVISLFRENEGSAILRMYEWAHSTWPKFFDCRPIYPVNSLKDAGFEIRQVEKVSLFGLPNQIVIAARPA